MKPESKRRQGAPVSPLAQAVDKLSGVTLDAKSGLRIGTLMLGDQQLRVGIRPGTRSGTGPRCPLLVFNGIGANLELAGPFLAELSDVDTLIFDLPGAGRSPPPKRPYRLRTMARLADQLLDALGIAGAVDVMGVSWGGGLAQEFTIAYPRRVRRLVLAATTMGGPMWPGRPSVLMKMINPRRYVDKGYMASIAPELYGGDLRKDPAAIRLFTDHARAGDRRGYRYQLLAMLGWSSLPCLWRIRQPTLVLAGTDDPLVPFVNARLHAWLLPNAQLVAIDDGHLFLLTRARALAGLVSEFLTRSSQTPAASRTIQSGCGGRPNIDH